MLKIYLVRHGETSFNADGNRYCGITDVELTEKGKKQAGTLASLISSISFDAVYSSPLQRAKITAETAIPDASIQVDPRLIELDFGSWEGKTRQEFIEEDPGIWNKWNQDPTNQRAGGNGESAGKLLERLSDFMQDMIQKHPSGKVLVVAHNAVNRFLIASLLEIPLKNYRKIVQENSSITILGYEKTNGFSLLKLNCKS